MFWVLTPAPHLSPLVAVGQRDLGERGPGQSLEWQEYDLSHLRKSALIYDGIIKFFEFVMSHMYEAWPTETCIWTWRFVGTEINNSVGDQYGWVTHNCHQDKRLFCSSVEIFPCRGALQCAAVSCSVLQWVAVCYSVCSNKELGVFVSCDDLNAERHLTCCFAGSVAKYV